MPPATPDFAGRPISNSHSPERSYSPCRRHDREGVAADVGGDHALARHRVHPAVCEGRPHHGEIVGRDAEGALTGVDVDDLIGVARHPTVAAKQPPHRPIALIRRGLGGVDDPVQTQRAPGECRQPLPDALPLFDGRGAGHERRRRDRTGIDHRVHRMPGVELERHERIEGEPGVVHADDVAHPLVAVLLDRQGVDEHLRDRLDRERMQCVARIVRTAVDLDDREAEQLGIDLGEHGDVIRDGSAAVVRVAPVGLADQLLDALPRGERPRRHLLRDAGQRLDVHRSSSGSTTPQPSRLTVVGNAW